MSRVLLTGGAGYIGSHTAKLLAKTGFEPVTLDNLSTGHRWAVKWGPFIQGDIADQKLVCDIIAHYKINAVLHFAACASVAESMRLPCKYFDNNVIRSMKLIHALVGCAVKHIIFSSSCATYGLPRELPVKESHPQDPLNPYGSSKLMIEQALRWQMEAHELASVCLRYFNAAGADPDGELGEVHDPETHLIPRTIRAVLGSQAVDVYGTDYKTRDGSAIRDYTHVMDLAKAHVLALRYLLDGGESDAFNLGTGHGHSVYEVIETVHRVSRREVQVNFCPRRRGDPPTLVADACKAQSTLGWKPSLPDLLDIVRTAWEWHSAWEESSISAAI
jgi:UDP-glucose-4-epimerase GalE